MKNKLYKKKKKLQDRIDDLELEMYTNLKQKTSSTSEISLVSYQKKLSELRRQLELLS